MAEGIARTTRIRIEGTRNLVAAALEAGVRRVIAQSLACWVYADGPQPYSENAPLDLRAEAPNAIVVEGVAMLEQLTTMSPVIRRASMSLLQLVNLIGVENVERLCSPS